MDDQSKQFLSTNVSAPHHRKAIALLVIAVIVFGILILAYALQTQPTSQVPVNTSTSIFTSDMNIAEKKATVLGIVSNAPTTPLTPEVKRDILQEFGGEKTAQYSFTPAEKQAILDAMNKK